MSHLSIVSYLPALHLRWAQPLIAGKYLSGNQRYLQGSGTRFSFLSDSTLTRVYQTETDASGDRNTSHLNNIILYQSRLVDESACQFIHTMLGVKSSSPKWAIIIVENKLNDAVELFLTGRSSCLWKLSRCVGGVLIWLLRHEWWCDVEATLKSWNKTSG